MASYYSKESRVNKNVPMEEIDIEITLPDYTIFKTNNPIAQGYNWLKQNVVGFEDAIDDMDVIEPDEFTNEQST